MRNISHEMKSYMRSKDKLFFARKNYASPVSRSPFYSLRKRKKSANSIESLMCSHPSYFGISHTRFRAKNFAVVESGLKAKQTTAIKYWRANKGDNVKTYTSKEILYWSATDWPVYTAPAHTGSNNKKLYKMEKSAARVMRGSNNAAIVLSFIYLGKLNTDFMKRSFSCLLFIIREFRNLERQRQRQWGKYNWFYCCIWAKV
jgi:hypothetical protein